MIYVATPVLDYIPISEVLTFTKGQSQGDVLCVPITIIEDVFVEAKETFEVVLLPTPKDLFKVLFIPGMNRAMVIISDGERYGSMYAIKSTLNSINITIILHVLVYIFLSLCNSKHLLVSIVEFY